MANQIIKTEEFTQEDTNNSIVEEEQPELEEQSEPSEANDTEEQPSEESVAEEEVVEEAPQKIKIGDQEFTPEELQEIVPRGTKVKEYETKMPGFKIDSLMADYTRKSQLLAEIQRKGVQPVKAKESLEELGVDQEQIKAFEKVAKHLGFIRHEDIVNDTVDSQKLVFITRHPEYSTERPDGKDNWDRLMQEFSIYNWQQHPGRVEEWLEAAHGKLNNEKNEDNRNQHMAQEVKTKAAVAKTAAMSGGGVVSAKTVTSSNPHASMFDKFRAMGWTEEQIKEIQ